MANRVENPIPQAIPIEKEQTSLHGHRARFGQKALDIIYAFDGQAGKSSRKAWLAVSGYELHVQLEEQGEIDQVTMKKATAGESIEVSFLSEKDTYITRVQEKDKTKISIDYNLDESGEAKLSNVVTIYTERKVTLNDKDTEIKGRVLYSLHDKPEWISGVHLLVARDTIRNTLTITDDPIASSFEFPLSSNIYEELESLRTRFVSSFGGGQDEKKSAK